MGVRPRSVFGQGILSSTGSSLTTQSGLLASRGTSGLTTSGPTWCILMDLEPNIEVNREATKDAMSLPFVNFLQTKQGLLRLTI